MMGSSPCRQSKLQIINSKSQTLKFIYLDYAAGIGNPSSIHSAGREAKALLETARAKIGAVISARPEEIIFTGSGSEANNLALNVSGHIVTTNIEHHSVMRPAQQRNATFVPVEPNGIVNPQKILAAIRPNTVLVSVHYANNEIGVIQPIKEIKKKIENWKLKIHGKTPFFHVDACQAAGYLPLNVQELGVDLMTLNASKIYGPKGIGCLFVRRGVKIAPMILGGDQERGRRAGTESVELAVSFAEALEIASEHRKTNTEKLTKLRDWFIAQLPEARLNGDPVERLPNNINISFDGVDGEMLLLALDAHGICVSTGAACTTTSNEPSHVLRAIAPQPPSYSKRGAKGEILGNLRLTLGRATTKKELEYTLKILKKEVARLQNLSAPSESNRGPLP